MTDLESAVRDALERHAAVDSVALAGSRARGTDTPLSDWDFQVETNDFAALSRDLPRLVDPLDPLARQWDRYSPHPTFMLMLRGPLKLDLLFLGRVNEPRPPWALTPETLSGIDDHFWDWALWLKSKERDRELSREQRALMHAMLLGPIGAPRVPDSVADAVALYLDARERAEAELGVSVDRALGEEVLKALR